MTFAGGNKQLRSTGPGPGPGDEAQSSKSGFESNMRSQAGSVMGPHRSCPSLAGWSVLPPSLVVPCL